MKIAIKALAVFALIVAGLLIFRRACEVKYDWHKAEMAETAEPEGQAETQAPTQPQTEAPTEAQTQPTATEETTEAETEPELVLLGEYKLTAYCPCVKCCNKDDGITATMTVATQGRTIAVDPKIIPYGSTVIINGHEYVAEDCGGSIKQNRIDIFFDSHEDALDFGVQYAKVFLKK